VENERDIFDKSAPRVALFGGSFNPIHIGHLIIARAVAEHLGIERTVLIPSASPPHKQANPELAAASHRLEMVRRAIDGEPGFECSDLEIRRHGPSYTFDTVQAYREQLGPRAAIHWIIGGVTLPELHTWYRARELVDACTIVTAVRPGFEKPGLAVLEPTLRSDQVAVLARNMLATPRIDISATQIRLRIRAGQSIRFLVPEAVHDYIQREGLYLGP
jgi:nicotinate-nucleotide adenylyltransferase